MALPALSYEVDRSRPSMKTMTLTLALAAVFLFGLADVSAHHPFSATYLYDERVSIEGEVVALIYRSPHPYVHVMAPDRDNRMRRWAIEWAGSQNGSRREMPVGFLMAGDHVIVTGSPGRDPGTFRILMRSIVRPSDGWRWSGLVP